eukprot:3444290-Amphidinium_carterae.1
MMLQLPYQCLHRSCSNGLAKQDSGTIYWSYIASRGQQLNFHVDTNTDDPQTLVLTSCTGWGSLKLLTLIRCINACARLVCMTRAQDEQGKASLIKATSLRRAKHSLCSHLTFWANVLRSGAS